MKVSNRILDYLKGSRKGKEANRLERDALNDAFLYEALEGLTETAGDHVREIELLEYRLAARINRRIKLKRGIRWAIAAVLLLGIGSWVLFQHKAVREYRMKKYIPLTACMSVTEDTVVVADNRAEKMETESASAMADETADVRKEKEQQEEKTTISKTIKPMSVAADTLWRKRSAGKQESVPVGGYENFYRYIQDSLRYPEDARQQGLQGDIRLSFVVNKAGRPSHIRVVKWITYSCNREAIRLLDKGPAWTYTGDTTYVVIPFRLEK